MIESEVVLLGSLLILILLKVPIAFALMFASILTIFHMDLDIFLVTQKLVEGVRSVPLLAIPFFVMAGEIMAKGGLTRRLLTFSNALIGHVQGGLAMVNVVASMFFGGVSGSSVADVSAIGSMLIPAMDEKGYDKDFSVNVTITSSQQGIIIPPSHNAIIYSLAAGGVVSVRELFMAGIIPGISIGLALMFVSYLIARRRGYPTEDSFSIVRAFKTGSSAIVGLFAFLIIIGGITFGIFTATEASAVAVVYALFVALFVYKEIKIDDIYDILIDSIKTITIVMFLIGSANIYGWLLSFLRVPGNVTEFLIGISDHRIVVFLLINLFLLLLGTIMDMAPLIVITTPILLPVVTEFGMSPVQFGIMLLLNLGIGLCTPPVGTALFVGTSVGETTIENVVKGIWPFYLAMIVVLLLTTFVPQFSLLIPNLLF